MTRVVFKTPTADGRKAVCVDYVSAAEVTRTLRDAKRRGQGFAVLYTNRRARETVTIPVSNVALVEGGTK